MAQPTNMELGNRSALNQENNPMDTAYTSIAVSHYASVHSSISATTPQPINADLKNKGWEINYYELQTENELGRGAFGVGKTSMLFDN
jgi:hypothetical protein